MIGSVGTLSGPVGSTFIGQVNAVQVWSRMVNERGGLNGHPVKLITADDGGDPARHRALVQQFVERDHVVAFVANAEGLTGQASVAYHNQVRVPVIGSEGGNQYFYESPMHFPQAAHGDTFLRAFLASTAQQALPEGKNKLATLLCREANACDRADALWGGGYAAELGFQLVYRGRASVAQPDFTAECLNAKSAGAEVIFMALDANSVMRVATSCARQGYHPLLAWAANATNEDQPKIPFMEGAIVAAIAFPWMLGDTPATAEFQGAMARYLPGVPPNGSHSVGWAAAKLFEKAMAGVPEPPTAAAVLEGLWKIHDDELGGLTYPITFTRDHPASPRLCWFNVRIRGGRFIAPTGAKYSCR